MILTVCVPASEDFHGIAPGSAIVGSESADETLRVDYEGGIHGQVGFESFARRAMQAAGRHVANYPTSARISLPRSQLHVIGTYDTDTWVLDVHDQHALDGWLQTRA